jgi:hypothetical protein
VTTRRPSEPVLPSPMPRGGKRPGAGRPRSGVDLLKARPGVPMSDEEWGAVVAYAEANAITNAEAMRRLVRLGLSKAG